MSAVWLTLTAIVSFSCRTALSGKVSSGPQWRDIGGSITIQCKSSLQDPGWMSLRWGLSEEVQILFLEKESRNVTVKNEFRHRVETRNQFPMLDVVIRNLTVEDTGAYWCVYEKMDQNYQLVQKKGHGSVLLVVKGPDHECKNEISSENTPSTLVVVCVLTAGIVLLFTFVGLFLLIIFKIKGLCTTSKPRRVATNDVYEDMRGTIRR